MGAVSADEDPVAWLRAQVEARLALARDAADGDSGEWFTGDKWNVYRAEDIAPYEDADEHDLVVYGNVKPQSGHIAANDPRDTIARCEGELAILDEHAPRNGYDQPEGDLTPVCTCCADDRMYGYAYPCRTVRLLARGYRHRAGYPEGFANATDSSGTQGP
jgi:hypothetical protein